ncbi:PadR family transcriptional regulator [Culicoidibacter larvae]|uniref:PadR family transcriptional regulator n=1 Tax=Culicoidibacter larvae TaxID=2579976 RepID=A0A5R8QDW6_9FIRM|nr:PadR family transcriptional regulator [Culicoidibacter larvae]TLG75378.1 PadR family transcriptional regulator [Culicoidibacter larvae]
MDTQLKKGTLELCILGLLSHRDWYGYELTQELNKGLQVKDATVYLILQRIEKAGVVEAYVKTIDTATKVRKYYRLTDFGKLKLQSLVEEWENLGSIITNCIEKGEIIHD